MEDGYEFFAKRHLVTLFSAPNYCGEFDNAGAMMSVDETLLCSFQVGVVVWPVFASSFLPTSCRSTLFPTSPFCFSSFVPRRPLTDLFLQILKPAEKKAKLPYGGMNMGRPMTPPRNKKKKDGKMS